MSAYIVSKRHIDLLVAGLLMTEILDTDPDTAGRTLWTENLRSVQARYPHVTLEWLPGDVGDDFDPTTYQYHDPNPKLSRAVPDLARLLKAIAAYQHQSCEHDAWQDSWAWERTEELRAVAELCLPEHLQALVTPEYARDPRPVFYSTDTYANAPWTIA